MKINKFSENIKNVIIDSINKKTYNIAVYDNDMSVIYSGVESNNKVTERYYELKKFFKNNKYVFLIQKEHKVLTEEEIELLNNANKYNL